MFSCEHEYGEEDFEICGEALFDILGGHQMVLLYIISCKTVFITLGLGR